MKLNTEHVQIMEAIDGAGPSSAKQLLELVTYTEERDVVRDDLLTMKAHGLLHKYGNGQWVLTEKGKRKLSNHAAERQKVKGSVTDSIVPPFVKSESLERAKQTKDVKHERVTYKDPEPDPVKESAVVDENLAKELENLTLKPEIKDLDKKLLVLSKVMELMPDGIKEVLAEIYTDLEE